ncbi:hypothetical protein AVEN_173575-1 [Araneus ventricosus]|uniref:Uncharacterized protein n=1 Tax=Araneus ventricosus TaxID=182803 RepID=A0A4Y2CR11_ARAVE|nr:hypothetical protein AVEN_173575-1 [Araneus ventricosus]
MFLLQSSEMQFWDDKRNVTTHSYNPMKHSQTVLTANKIQGTRAADILIRYTTARLVLHREVIQCRKPSMEFGCLSFHRLGPKSTNLKLIGPKFQTDLQCWWQD